MASEPEEPLADEFQSQKVLKPTCMLTLSGPEEHRFPHLPNRAWCLECVEAFARESAHLSSSSKAREFPLVPVDYVFLSDKGVVTRAESENQWDGPPRGFASSARRHRRIDRDPSFARGARRRSLTAEGAPPDVLLIASHGLIPRE